MYIKIYVRLSVTQQEFSLSKICDLGTMLDEMHCYLFYFLQCCFEYCQRPLWSSSSTRLLMMSARDVHKSLRLFLLGIAEYTSSIFLFLLTR